MTGQWPRVSSIHLRRREWPSQACAYHEHQYETTLTHPCEGNVTSIITVTEDQYAVTFTDLSGVNASASIIENRYDAATGRPVQIIVTIPRTADSVGSLRSFRRGRKFPLHIER